MVRPAQAALCHWPSGVPLNPLFFKDLRLLAGAMTGDVLVSIFNMGKWNE